MLRVSVEDTGKGIKPEEIDKVFQMFGKLKRTASLNNEGIGLGLMICKKLVQLNEGQISLHSDGQNKGCTISFSMKALDHEPEQPNEHVDLD